MIRLWWRLRLWMARRKFERSTLMAECAKEAGILGTSMRVISPEVNAKFAKADCLYFERHLARVPQAKALPLEEQRKEWGR